MQRLVVIVASVLLASAAFAAPAGAAPLSATATGIGTQASTSCGDNPSFDISGTAVGDGFGSDGWGTVAGDPVPTPAITTSPLYDDWTASASDWAVVFPAAAPDGTVRGLYAVVGTPDLNPATAMEWFLLYSCGTPGTASTVLVECFGPVGTCPRTVDEAMTFDTVISPTDPRPGGQITVSATGCLGGTIGAGLFDQDGVRLTLFDPQPATAAGVTGELTVPLAIASGATLDVVAVCSIDGVAQVLAAVTVSGGSTPTTTTTSVAPGTSVPAIRSVSPAAALRFAG